MSTAIKNFGKTVNQTEVVKTNRPQAKRYIHREKFSTRLRRAAGKAFFYSLTIFTLTAVAATIGFIYFYNHYSAIVEKRVKSGFWHTRAGVYSAPFVLRKNQKTSQESVVHLLRRAGYMEGESPEEIWNGSFTVKGNTIEIKANESFNLKNPAATLKFAGNKIVEINNGSVALEEYRIEPEMLTGRSEAKRGETGVLHFDEIPENLKNAILTAEDQRFFNHYGIDPRGIGRAFLKNFNDGAIRQGGSTITQQLVKNTFLSPEKSFARKFSEAFLAIALERKMSKKDIFALYCNEIYLGQYGSTGVHGVKQAARAYFDKDLQDLNLTEAAAIAAMIKNPNHFAPHKKEQESKTRRVWIISKMAELGLVSPANAETALQTGLALAKPKLNDKTVAPYFVDAALRDLTTNFKADYLNTNFNTRVYTTIDTHLQGLAEQAVADQLAKFDKIFGKKGVKLQAALVALNPANGHVLAMVGGRDYRESQFNRAADARRQPGSTFKPFVYATAFERGLTSMNVSADVPTKFEIYGGKPYKPANFGNFYAGQNITLKTALAKSSNVVAVKTALDTGLYSVARQAEAFGFENVDPYPSLALGAMEVTPLQLAAAYAVFANGGRQVKPVFIDKIITGAEDAIYLSMPSKKQIISEKTAFMITDMLEAVVERGTARAVKGALGKDVVFAGKTGSSKDGWFIGYTPNLVTVAWIGNDENEDIGMTGGEAALPLWTDFMKAVAQTRPEFGGDYFPRPRGMSEITIDPETGMLADHNCPRSETVIIPVSAASNIKCLKHQPLPENYLAAETTDPLVETTIVIEPAGQVAVESEIRVSEPAYKELNGISVQTEPIELKKKIEPKKTQRPVKKSYFDDSNKPPREDLNEKETR